MKTVSGSISLAGGDATFTLSAVLSPFHLVGAQLFADEAASMEGAGAPDGDRQHRARVVGAVVLAVAYLEAFINEFLFREAVVPDQWRVHGGDDPEEDSVVEKFQVALRVKGKEKFDKGREPYQSAQLVVRLRNALVHYKPQARQPTATSDSHSRLETSLRNMFEANPLAPNAALWFPTKCLGSPCARWAVASSKVFVEAFCERIGG